MTSHIIFAALDDQHPATLSSAILDNLLRKEMGFEGLIITDAMDMHAVSKYGHFYSVNAALGAGADLVLLGHLPDQLNLSSLVEIAPRTNSLRRIQNYRNQVPSAQPSLNVLGCSEHRAIARQVAERAITLVKDSGRLPLQIQHDERIIIITPVPTDLTPADTSSRVIIRLAEFIRKRHVNTQSVQIPFAASSNDITAALQATRNAEVVIVGTIRADSDLSQAELVNNLYQRGMNPIVIALRTPYDLTAFPMIETYLCSYGIRNVTMEAVVRILFGQISPRGVLPCVIPDNETDSRN